jgi:5'-methylthioadenosine phosphorylase
MKVGIIGGSGLDDPKLLHDSQQVEMDTPYGKPSSSLTCGVLNGAEVCILARHGRDHSLMPTRVPFRANIWALKKAGCTHILATTACGSLREDIEPGHIVFPDQFIDHTRLRPLTFHEDKVVHTPMADPFCGTLRRLLVESATRLGLRYHAAGTIVTIEGPRFSTRAESHMFRAWGADIINMSTVPEVVLAREAGACYQSIAMSTDYDCWKEDEAPVTWEMIVQRMEQNADNVKRLLIDTIPHIAEDACACRENGLT